MPDQTPEPIISPERLAEIWALTTDPDLTPGPWTLEYEDCDCDPDGCDHGSHPIALRVPVATGWSADAARQRGEPAPGYAYVRSEISDFSPADITLMAGVRALVPELLAVVERLNAELAKYVGWEPTVREEYDHACGQIEKAHVVLTEFRRRAASTPDAPHTAREQAYEFAARLLAEALGEGGA